MLRPWSAVSPMRVQVAPPSVDRNRPLCAPPVPPKLLRRPKPATTVFPVPSFGSIASPPIDCESSLSVSGTQRGFVASAFVVFHTPPLAVPMYIVFPSDGCGARHVTQPEVG